MSNYCDYLLLLNTHVGGAVKQHFTEGESVMNGVGVRGSEQWNHLLQRTFVKQRRTEAVAVCRDIAQSVRSLRASQYTSVANINQSVERLVCQSGINGAFNTI